MANPFSQNYQDDMNKIPLVKTEAYNLCYYRKMLYRDKYFKIKRNLHAATKF